MPEIEFRYVEPKPPTHVGQYAESLICLCGNDPTLVGFACSTIEGVSLEAPPDSEIDQLDEWDGKHYRCERCHRVIDQDTLEVVLAHMAKSNASGDWTIVGTGGPLDGTVIKGNGRWP